MKTGISGRAGASLLLGVACALAAVSCTTTTPDGEGDVALSAAGAERAALRAFYTAPPVIPHEVEDRGNESCGYCHHEEDEDGNQVALSVPHATFSNCRQCHVTFEPPFEVDDVELDTSWIGLREPARGRRAHEGAPPTMPHRVFLRENCLSCHGPEGLTEGMATSHPERTNCSQCHVADVMHEF